MSGFPWREKLLASPAVAVAVFCIGLLSCTGLGVALVVSLIDRGGAKVDVTGVSTEQVRSDQVQWSFTIKSESANRSQGALIQEKQVAQAIAFLEKNKISRDDSQGQVQVLGIWGWRGAER